MITRSPALVTLVIGLVAILVTCLPTDGVPSGSAVVEGRRASKLAARVPLPHGWYGHDATTPTERENQIKARDAAAKAAADIDARTKAAYRPLQSKRDVEYFDGNMKRPDFIDNMFKRVNNDAYRYDKDGKLIIDNKWKRSSSDEADGVAKNSIRLRSPTPSDLPKADPKPQIDIKQGTSLGSRTEMGSKVGAKAKRFSDDGVSPPSDWFSIYKRTLPAGRKVSDSLTEAIQKRYVVRAEDACSPSNYKCRSVEEKQQMADAMSGKSSK